jgi:hypothetical protein
VPAVPDERKCARNAGRDNRVEGVGELRAAPVAAAAGEEQDSDERR